MSGRPRLLTPERERRILEAIAQGATRGQAAQAAGVHRATFMRWMAAGEAQESGPERDFCDAVREADGAVAVAMCRVVTNAAETGTWQAAAWWLERRHPTEYGRHVAVRTETGLTTAQGAEAPDARRMLMQRLERLLPPEAAAANP